MSMPRMRWPAMHARPPQTPGVLVMCCVITFSMAISHGNRPVCILAWACGPSLRNERPLPARYVLSGLTCCRRGGSGKPEPGQQQVFDVEDRGAREDEGAEAERLEDAECSSSETMIGLTIHCTVKSRDFRNPSRSLKKSQPRPTTT